MKINLLKNLKGYKGLRSSVVAGYMIALSPVFTALVACLSFLVLGNTSKLGLLSAQIYTYALFFGVLFLCLDLYRIILKDREFESFKSTLKTKPELFILLGFLLWNILATILQLSIFGESHAYTTIIYPLGIQEGLFAFVIYGFCVLMAYYVKQKDITKNILFTFLCVVLALSFFAIIDPTGKLIFQIHSNTSWASMFFNSNHFGYVLVLATTLSGIGFVLTTVKWEKILSLVFLVVFCITSFFVDTFGSLIAIFAAFLLIPIVLTWFKKKFSWKYLIPLGVFVVLSFAMIPFGNWKYYSTYRSFFSQIGGLFKDTLTVAKDVSDSAPTSDAAKQAGTNRWGLWLMAFEQIAKSPIIGTGDVLLRPHNEYLQFAQVWGLPSAILYLSAFVVIFIKAIKHRAKLSNLTSALIFCIGAFLISAMFGNTMPHTTPFFALFLGFLIRWMNHDITRHASPELAKKEQSL